MTNQNQVAEKMSTTYEVNGETVKLSPGIIKKYLVRGNKEVNDQEIMMFLSLCKYQKLNPFLNEAYLVKFGGDAQIIVGKEAFMKRAESNAKYKGIEAGIIVERNNELHEIEGAVKLKNDVLIGGWAKVYRADRDIPVVSKVSVEEYDKKQSTWKQMPLTMIRKTAIVNALREAFPENLGAMYTEEESNQPINVNDDVQQEINQNANKTAIDIPKEEPQKVEKPNEKEKVEVESAQFEEVKEPKQTKQSIFDEGLFGNEN
ncbi:phage recombination protein Bet [Mammaliicoccus fleurettii]|uniref:phage recombination protein Bet n=1 Tax=Mammaliicoccus fleurettii TaxID=150056 RepID=UPI001AAD9101|nr:phage recombination protein Bet [Mammaliicoccus fleurettii]MBO3062761.1 phage recombination protein Bet [Mammaliicoccus fleurettii]